jgi:outer membrane lipoprotein-sorting protein
MFRRHRDINIGGNEETDQKQKSGPKTGKVYITYKNYQINTGLADELFEQKKENDNPDN